MTLPVQYQAESFEQIFKRHISGIPERFLRYVHSTTRSIWISTLTLADETGREHFHILRSVGDLRDTYGAEWFARHLKQTAYPVDLGMGRTRQDPAYECSKEAATILLLSMTGEKAAHFKREFVQSVQQLSDALDAAVKEMHTAQLHIAELKVEQQKLLAYKLGEQRDAAVQAAGMSQFQLAALAELAPLYDFEKLANFKAKPAANGVIYHYINNRLYHTVAGNEFTTKVEGDDGVFHIEALLTSDGDLYSEGMEWVESLTSELDDSTLLNPLFSNPEHIEDLIVSIKLRRSELIRRLGGLLA